MSCGYEITIQDVKDYLKTVPEGEPVGVPQHFEDCLLGHTMRHKYPWDGVAVGPGNVNICVNGSIFTTPYDVRVVGDKFDALWPDWDHLGDALEENEPITLAALRSAIPELFEEATHE